MGSGGQGIVYSGIHKRTGRRVAVKVLREDGSPGVMGPRRFEREIDLCRTLRHPGIARLLGSGTTFEGRRYLVMEYIDGVPLDEYWETGVETEEFLGAFRKICDTVFHAHQRGIIHRDLKPGNIRIDLQGRPRILDFGLAKPVSRSSIEIESLSSTGDFLGSLPWASPEQVAGNKNEIDVRTDIYSLGVLLYQALSGSFPYDISGNLKEVLHNITDTPPRPLKLKGYGSLRDLERVVFRCLQKDPDRRYPTALSLSEDIGRIQRGEPVEQSKQSLWTGFRRLWARHRTATIASIALVLGLTVFGSAMAILYRKTSLAEEEKSIALDETRKTKLRVEAVNEFLLGAFIPGCFSPEGKLLVDPESLRLTDAVANAATRLEEDPSLKDRPGVRADLHQAMCFWYAALNDLDLAERQAEKAIALTEEAFGPDDPDLATPLQSLGWICLQRGESKEAESFLQRSDDLRRTGDPAKRIPTLRLLVTCAQHLGDQAKYRSRLEELLPLLVETQGEDSPGAINVRAALE